MSQAPSEEETVFLLTAEPVSEGSDNGQFKTGTSVQERVGL